MKENLSINVIDFVKHIQKLSRRGVCLNLKGDLNVFQALSEDTDDKKRLKGLFGTVLAISVFGCGL